MKRRGATPEEDRELGLIEEGEIRSVKPFKDGSGWEITADWSCALLTVRAQGMTPKVGDTVTTFGQIGYAFHGQALNGKILWYQSIEQEEAEHREQEVARVRKKHERFEADRARLDADYDSLPEPFRARIDKFRRTNPDFRWEFESYEMMCCIDALLIARWCSVGTHVDGEPTTADNIRAFKDLPWDEQRKAGISEGHSANSFGFAVRLALLFVTAPSMVVQEHGAMTSLVGCIEYGCPHAKSDPQPGAPSGRPG